ncbi:hypothetical protein [Kamptonema formosum]|uniref:hypothetical protein n=1 Tax=Kamptonema formosum TaxID=331992 RepID=UPI001E53B3DB|nr:hypothetical protein [Oscillatoria sp. PCC 10802]
MVCYNSRPGCGAGCAGAAVMSGKIQQFLAVSLVGLIGVSAAACARKPPVAPAGTRRDAGAAGVPPSAAPQPSKGKSESRQIELPHSRGETWYVCQGVSIPFPGFIWPNLLASCPLLKSLSH